MENQEQRVPEGYMELRRRKTFIVYAAIYAYFLLMIAAKFEVINLSFLNIPGLDLMMPFYIYLLGAAAAVPFVQYLFATRVYKSITMYNWDELKAFRLKDKIYLFMPVLLLALSALKEAALLSIVYITVYLWFSRAYRPFKVNYDYLDRYDVDRRDSGRYR